MAIDSARPTLATGIKYVFPWSASIVVDESNPDGMFRFIPSRPIHEGFASCPIYGALSPTHQRELILRAPKTMLRYNSYVWGLLQASLDSYGKFQLGGVSPLTAMGLFAPEPRCEISHSGPFRVIVAPETITPLDPIHGRPMRRRTQEWHVVVWALKRYAGISWSEVAALGTDIRRGFTSLRQTVRRNVEEPLAAFYLEVTGRTLEESLYSCALSDRPDSPLWAKEQMRKLKREARAKLDGIPTN